MLRSFLAKLEPPGMTEVTTGLTVVLVVVAVVPGAAILVMLCTDVAVALTPVGVRQVVTSELEDVDLGIGSLAFELTMLLRRLVDVADRAVNDIGLNFLVLHSPRLVKLRLLAERPPEPRYLPLAMLLSEEETSLKRRLLEALILASLLLIISFISSRL